MNRMLLEDPVINKQLYAEANFGEGGGWKISISPYNFIYSRLKDNPRAFVGMVFRNVRTTSDNKTAVMYLKVSNAVHRWVPASKRGELPFLEYLAVKFDTLPENFMVIAEAIEIHRQKIEGEYKEDADQGN